MNKTVKCVCAAGEPVTQEALDKRCEIWLDRVFGLKLDFAIEQSACLSGRWCHHS